MGYIIILYVSIYLCIACSRAPLYDDQTMFWLILRTNTRPLAAPLKSCPTTASNTAHTISTRSSSSSSYNKGNTDSSRIVTCPLDDCLFSASHLRTPDTVYKLVSGIRMRANIVAAAE